MEVADSYCPIAGVWGGGIAFGSLRGESTASVGLPARAALAEGVIVVAALTRDALR